MTIELNTVTPKFAYISLGPTCLGAEILKAANLRNCTYGFDWFRSGSEHIKDFMELDLEEFLIKNVFYPNIPLVQGCDPSVLLNKTAELVPCKPMYGYQYLYNPHRSYNKQLNMNYFRRCFERLKLFVSKQNNYASFLLADFPGTSHGSFLDETKEVAVYLETLLRNNCICKFDLKFLRISFSLSASNPPCIQRFELSSTSKIYYFSVSSAIQESDYMRKHLYSSIAKLSLEKS